MAGPFVPEGLYEGGQALKCLGTVFHGPVL